MENIRYASARPTKELLTAFELIKRIEVAQDINRQAIFDRAMRYVVGLGYKNVLKSVAKKKIEIIETVDPPVSLKVRVDEDIFDETVKIFQEVFEIERVKTSYLMKVTLMAYLNYLEKDVNFDDELVSNKRLMVISNGMGEESKKIESLNFFEWNIHGYGGYGNYAIPNFVADTILEKNADIIILVEFIIGKGWDYFVNTLEKKYNIFVSPYATGRNQVLIALKKGKEFNIKEILTLNPLENGKPEFLRIDLEWKQKPLTIIGVRIKSQGTNQEIASQFSFLEAQLTLLTNTNVLCSGDFNVWKNPLSEKLNLKRLNEKAKNKFCVSTPKHAMERNNFDSLTTWSSIVKNMYGKIGKALIDHIIIKGLIVNDPLYSWDFVKERNGYGKLQKEAYKSHLIGLPDHAILTATIEF